MHGGREGCGVGHGLVGGGDDEYRILVALPGGQCGKRQRRRGVAANGLQQCRCRVQADFTQLLERQEAVLFIGDDEGRGYIDIFARQPNQAPGRLLEQAFFACQT